MRRLYIATLLLLLSCTLCSAQKRFFNLTADEVKIDSVLPLFTHAIRLDEHYADSVYTAEIPTINKTPRTAKMISTG